MKTILTLLVSNVFSTYFYDSKVVQTLYPTSHKLNVMTYVFIFLLQNILNILSCVHIQNDFIFKLDFGWTIFWVYFTLLGPRKLSNLVNVCFFVLSRICSSPFFCCCLFFTLHVYCLLFTLHCYFLILALCCYYLVLTLRCCLPYVVIVHYSPCIVVAHYSPCIVAICSTLSIHLTFLCVAITHSSPCISIAHSLHCIIIAHSLLYIDVFCSSPCIVAITCSLLYITIVHSLACVTNVLSSPYVVDVHCCLPCVVASNYLFVEVMHSPPPPHPPFLPCVGFKIWSMKCHFKKIM